MKVSLNKQDEDKPQFGTLKEGEVFIFDDVVFMKTGISFTALATRAFNAVCLTTGTFESFRGNEKVIPIDGSFVQSS